VEERIELVPSVHRQATLRKPEHRRRVLGKRKAWLTGIAGAVDQEVLQGAAEPELDRGERCKEKSSPVLAGTVELTQKRCYDLPFHF
jgi:hypothetical protein